MVKILGERPSEIIRLKIGASQGFIGTKHTTKGKKRKENENHRRVGRGGGKAQPPQNLGNLDFLGSKRSLGKANF